MEKRFNLVSRLFVTLVIIILCISFITCQDVVYNLTEGLPENTYLGNVAESSNLKSRLVDPNDINSITYSFIGSEYVALFHLNERESSLYTSEIVDRETLCEYKPECVIILEVIAKCTSSSCYEKLVVKINVIDVNDNYPTFPKQKLDLEFSEGSLLGTSVPIEAAVDLDSGIYSIQEYTTEQIVPIPEASSKPYFVVKLQKFGDTTIVSISLNRTLDRENHDNFIIRVVAFDGGMPPKTGSLDLNITVIDINDNPPKFTEKSYNVTVNENVVLNSTILSVHADDPDNGINGKILYTLSPNQDDDIHSLFFVNEVTGEIKVIGSLMNGPIENYRISVRARDQAAQPLMSQTNVFVHIRDVVNSPPQININLLSKGSEAEISEAAGVDAAVAHIKVSDPDKGQNGKINCTVISDKFKLQPFDQNEKEFKVVVAETLNREVKDQHSVTVVCVDAGVPPQTASASFVVQVLDENDLSPVFSQQHYSVNFPENNNVGASLLTVTASDFDSGKNAEIKYELHPTDVKYFKIDQRSGLIVANSVFDRETMSLFSFPVYCKDGGSPSNTATTTVTVHITDENDNTPVFSDEHYIFSVPENFGRAVNVGTLRATDKDIGKNRELIFSVKNTKTVPFRVLPNGTISTREVLDREVSSKYEFEVVTSDGGSPPLSSVALVTVFVLDENDNRPEFIFPNSKNNTVVMSYQTPPNTIVTTISTVDRDDGLNSKVTYFLRGDDVSNIFQLNSLSGRLILIKHLSVSDAKRYTFGVIAQDKGTPPKISERTMSVVVTTQKLDSRVTADFQETHKEYFLIAIAITCVTIVLAVVIVIAIFLIRRKDQLKKKCDSNGIDNGKEDPKKRVSFSSKDAIITVKPPGDKDQGYQRFKTTLYEVQGQNQRFQNGYPFMFDKLDVSELDKREKKQNQIKNLKLQEVLQHNKRKDGTIVTPSSNGPLGDSHSDVSGEATTSDSGRGGSEDDLHNSTLLSYSAEFDDVKCSSPRTVINSSFSNQKSKDNFCTVNSDYRRNNYSRTPVRPVSFSDKFFNFENSSIGIFPKNYDGFSPTGNSSICTGHDDSTTTSGSYTIDDDDYVEVAQRSKQCIV